MKYWLFVLLALCAVILSVGLTYKANSHKFPDAPHWTWLIP